MASPCLRFYQPNITQPRLRRCPMHSDPKRDKLTYRRHSCTCTLEKQLSTLYYIVRTRWGPALRHSRCAKALDSATGLKLFLNERARLAGSLCEVFTRGVHSPNLSTETTPHRVLAQAPLPNHSLIAPHHQKKRTSRLSSTAASVDPVNSHRLPTHWGSIAAGTCRI